LCFDFLVVVFNLTFCLLNYLVLVEKNNSHWLASLARKEKFAMFKSFKV